MKYKIIIERHLKEEYEMELEGNSIMEAFDEARKLVNTRNEKTHLGRFSVTKIQEAKEE